MAVDKSRAKIRRMFGEIAGCYDLLNHLLSLNVDRYWRWRTVQLVPPVAAGRVLDVCTGTGDLALAYFRAGRGEVNVIGVDFCHPMLVRGRAKSKKRAADKQVVFVEADAERLPFPDERFEVVSVAFGLRNVADAARGLAEMARVCARGGKVVVLEFSLPSRQPLRGVYRWYFQKVLPIVGQLVSGSRENAYNYLPASVGEFPAGEALAQRMRAAGLCQVASYQLTLGIATLYVGTKKRLLAC